MSVFKFLRTACLAAAAFALPVEIAAAPAFAADEPPAQSFKTTKQKAKTPVAKKTTSVKKGTAKKTTHATSAHKTGKAKSTSAKTTKKAVRKPVTTETIN